MKSAYNKIAYSYRSTRTSDSEDVQLLRLLFERLPVGAMVFDAGCGSGYAVAQALARSFQMTGILASTGTDPFHLTENCESNPSILGSEMNPEQALNRDLSARY